MKKYTIDKNKTYEDVLTTLFEDYNDPLFAQLLIDDIEDRLNKVLPIEYFKADKFTMLDFKVKNLSRVFSVDFASMIVTFYPGVGTTADDIMLYREFCAIIEKALRN
jgi:hypothetical protein